MAGQKVEKVFNHEKKDFENFCVLNENLRRESTSALAYTGMQVPTVVSLSYLNYAVSACAGGLFALSGLMDLGSLASYLVYVRQSAMPLNQFTQQVNLLMTALAGAERIFDLMEAEPEVDEGDVTLCNVKEEEGRRGDGGAHRSFCLEGAGDARSVRSAGSGGSARDAGSAGDARDACGRRYRDAVGSAEGRRAL